MTTGRRRAGAGARSATASSPSASARARETVRGRVAAHGDGYGFVVRDDGGEDVYLPAREMLGVMHGDRVLCEVRASGARGRDPARRTGAVLEVLERDARQVVGRLFRDGAIALVTPEGRDRSRDVVVTGKTGGGRDGELVVAELEGPPAPGKPAAGRVVERLGDPGAPGMAAEVALRAHGIPREWPGEALAEAERLPIAVDTAASAGRYDLRPLPLVTIDGPDAKDFDDAVHAAPRPGGWKLTVAIADVSHYVAPGSALDREAAERGTSVYLPGRTVPMLPERLSNGLCSLNPEVDRLCFACELYVDRRGRVERARFRDAVMRSHARLTYEEVEAAVFGRDTAARRRLGGLLPHLEALRGVYGALRRVRRRRGAVDLDIAEPRIVFARDGRVSHVEPAPRFTAHQLIEECMLAANVAAARRLARTGARFLYRVHPPPDEEKAKTLASFLARAGIELAFGPDGALPPGALAAAAERAAERPDAEVLHLQLLRAMSLAVYQPDNAGHYGLALERYTHFTSPIRRYPDLLVHRALRAPHGYSEAEMEALGRSTSSTERRAEDAARDAAARLTCEYLGSRAGEAFAGRVAAVTSFGAFVRLQGLGVDGLVHVSALGGDWYRYDPAGQYLEGERGGRRIAVGDEMEVRVVSAEPERRRIHLEPVEAAAAGAARGGRGGGRRAPGRGGGGGGPHLPRRASARRPVMPAKPSPDLVYGLHPVAAVLDDDPSAIREVWAAGQGAGLARLVARIEAAGLAVQRCERRVLDRLAAGGRHQGVAARVRVRPPPGWRDFLASLETAAGSAEAPLVLVLDRVQDPRNLGACVRSAAAAAAAAVVVPRRRAAGVTAAVRRTAAGAVERVPVVEVPNLARALGDLAARGFAVVGAESHAPEAAWAADLGGPLALVLGAEGEGLRRLTRERCDRLVSIPMTAGGASLNVSVAAGVLLYEALRQRRARG